MASKQCGMSPVRSWRVRLGDALLGSESAQRVRSSMALIALVVYLLFAVGQHGEVLLGLVDRAESNALTAFNLCGGFGFYLLVRSGWSIKLSSEPSLTMPQIAVRMRNPFIVVLVCAGFYASAFAGLLIAPMAAPALWVALLGLGPSTFPLSLTMINLRTRTPEGSAALSGFMQGVGYSLSCAGPLAFGLLHDYTHAWTLPMAFLGACIVVLVIGGLAAGAAGAAAITRAIRALLIEVPATDPAVYAIVVAALGVVALAACSMPARRATLTDPNVALRTE